MKKVFIVLLMAFIIVPIITLQHVEAAVYNESEWECNDNDAFERADYIPLDKFDVQSYEHPMYHYTTNYNTATIKAYSSSTTEGGSDYDFFGFYIPYDTTLIINTISEYYNDERINNVLEYKLYKVVGDGREEISASSATNGLSVTAGYYVLNVNEGDNGYITRTVPFLFWTREARYYFTNYEFVLRYNLKPADYTDTSKTIYQSKLDSNSAALWVNDYNLEGLYFTNNDEGENIISDYMDHMGYDVDTVNDLDLFNETGIVDKRIYILSEEMREFTYTFLINFLNVLDDSRSIYNEKVEEGQFGIGNWNETLGIENDNAQAIEDGLGLIFDCLEVPPGVGQIVSIFSFAIEKCGEQYEMEQYIIMVETIHAIMMETGMTISELENNPELIDNYFNLFVEVFGDMISKPEYLDEAITLAESLKSSLHTFDVLSNADGDNYMYIDIIANYQYTPSRNIYLGDDMNEYPIYDHIGAQIVKLYNIRQFDVDGTTYPYMIFEGSDDDGENYWKDLEPDTLLSEEVEYKGTINKGTLTYFDIEEDLTERNLNITLSEANIYGTTQVVNDEKFLIFPSYFNSSFSDKILNNIYAWDAELGFLEVCFNYTLVSTRTIELGSVRKITRVYKIVYYIPNPTGGDDYIISDFEGKITKVSTITIGVIKPGPIQIVGW